MTERKSYYSNTKELKDSTRLEIKTQNWLGDSILKIKTQFGNEIEETIRYFVDCNEVKSEFVEKNDLIKKTIEYKYFMSKEYDVWLKKEIFLVDDDVYNLEKTIHQIVKMY